MKTFKKFLLEEVAANAVGANPPDAVKVAGEPFKKVDNSIVGLRRNNKKIRNESLQYKICRNCGKDNQIKKRKCHNCGGNKFDDPTPEHIKNKIEKRDKMNSLIKSLLNND